MTATVSPPAAPWAYTLTLPNDPRAPGVARRTLRTVLAAHGMSGLADTAELLASELVTNAHRYSSEPYTLRLRTLQGPDRLRVSVWDANPVIPPPFRGPLAQPPDCEAERGRGLLLVQLCADSWGACELQGGVHGSGGKLLWVECQWGDLS
ncbi:ATP-binding protein [Streptomyces sp. P9(2023)]|uniref:ATP-binding protein n=1 Tax=Streptomyces sp. P9(2023) TaxID=3064394 RepID=UPI0028F445E7|nr:ATP-binding protein [Streptomyces sp. P9(2023)]MDT9693250.1 ATP-binding protein [Streptomyces sp. P9(2023)]